MPVKMHKVFGKEFRPNPWKPDRPVSEGATAYHNAVANAPYYLENLDELVKFIRDKIRNNDLIVDFGAGTGVSSIFLLKNLKIDFRLWLVDNSAAWLGKAYEILKNRPNVQYYLLEKVNDRYATLSETLGEGAVDHVVSANTIHLIPNLDETFKGINAALRVGGTFTFQSGNVIRNGREEGVLMIDDTIKRVHDISLEIVRADKRFAKYKKDLNKRIEIEFNQRKFVFPDPRPLNVYLKALKAAGFEYEKHHYKLIKIKYKDWLDFLRVKRLEAGILPEIGGKDPSPEEEKDRDELITMASNRLFEELKNKNPLADDECFTTEWVYVTADRPK